MASQPLTLLGPEAIHQLLGIAYQLRGQLRTEGRDPLPDPVALAALLWDLSRPSSDRDSSRVETRDAESPGSQWTRAQTGPDPDALLGMLSGAEREMERERRRADRLAQGVALALQNPELDAGTRAILAGLLPESADT